MAQHSKSDPKVEPELSAHKTAAHDDDLIVVPKGQSRFQFFLILGLFIFILVTFTVGPYVQSVLGGMFSGAGPDTVYCSWVDPETGVKSEVDYPHFMRKKQALDALRQLNFYFSVSMRDGGERSEVTDAETGMWLILDQLAKDHGIEITNDDLRRRIEMTHGSLERYQQELRGYQAQGFTASAAEVESDLESWMRAELYSIFLTSMLTVADPADIERLWSEDPQNVEHAFDYVQIPAADYLEEARARMPDDEGLLAWLHTQSEDIQKAYRTDDRITVEVAWVSLDGAFDSAPLLEKYPVPEGWDEAAQARTYYNHVSHLRFRVPPGEQEEKKPDEQENGEDATGGEESETETGTEGETAEAGTQTDTQTETETEAKAEAGEETETADASKDATATQEPTEPPETPRYRTFEEVEATARVEAGWKRALDAWLADISQRPDAGETVDFAAEAEAFGIAYAHTGEPMSRAELEKMPGWGGPLVVGGLFFAQPKRFVKQVQIKDDALVLGRQVEKSPGVEKPIDELRDQLQTAWAAERSAQIAVEKLEAVRDVLGTRPAADSSEVFLPTVDRETFTAAAEAAGFVVVQRPFLRRFSLPNDDFDAATQADHHIRTSQTVHALEEGQVPAAEKNAEGTHAILVRVAGERTLSIDEMKPGDLERLRQQAIQESKESFQRRYLRGDSPEVRLRYQLMLRSLEPLPESVPPGQG